MDAAEEDLALLDKVGHLSITDTKHGVIHLSYRDDRYFARDSKAQNLFTRVKRYRSDFLELLADCYIVEEVDERVNTIEIGDEDVKRVAKSLNMEVDEDAIKSVIELYPSEAESDPSATWNLVVEKILHDLISDKVAETFQEIFDNDPQNILDIKKGSWEEILHETSIMDMLSDDGNRQAYFSTILRYLEDNFEVAKRKDVGEVPKDWHTYHHKNCGTMYRGCDSENCPKDIYERTGVWDLVKISNS